MKGYRWLKAAYLASWGVIALLLVGFVALMRTNNSAAIVTARDMLFTSHTRDWGQLDLPLPLWAGSKFRQDDLTYKPMRYEVIAVKSGRRNDLQAVIREPQTIRKVKKMINIFSASLLDRGCGTLEDLSDKIIAMPGGFGCCSDYAQVFLAYAFALNVPAREVQSSVHGFNEFWDANREKWILVDAGNAMMAKDDQGRYLSYREYRARRFAGQPVVLEFFGESVDHPKSPDHPKVAPFWSSAEQVREVVLTRGNDVWRQDEFYQVSKALPKPVRQFWGYMRGNYPPFLSFVDEHNAGQASRETAGKAGMVALAALLAGIHVLFPIVAWVRRSRERRSEPQPVWKQSLR